MEEFFGHKLRHRRLQKHLTLSELSRCTGVSMIALSNLERNHFLPTKILLEKLALCPNLNISYETLHEWKVSSKGFMPVKLWKCQHYLWPSCDIQSAFE